MLKGDARLEPKEHDKKPQQDNAPTIDKRLKQQDAIKLKTPALKHFAAGAIAKFKMKGNATRKADRELKALQKYALGDDKAGPDQGGGYI